MAKKKQPQSLTAEVDWAEAERILPVLHIDPRLLGLKSEHGHILSVARDDEKGMGLIGCPICNENYGFVNGSWIDFQSGQHVPDGDLATTLIRVWMEAGKQQKKKSKGAGSGK